MSESHYLDLLAAEEQTGEERDRKAMLAAREMLIALKAIPGTQVLQLSLFTAIEHALPRSAELLVEEAREVLAQAGRTSALPDETGGLRRVEKRLTGRRMT